MQANAKGELPKAYNKVLQSVQGQALRVVCGAFKNTSLEALEVETHTIPILIKAKQTLQLAMVVVPVDYSCRLAIAIVSEVHP